MLTWLEGVHSCAEWDVRRESKGAEVAVTSIGLDFEGSEKSLEGLEQSSDVM